MTVVMSGPTDIASDGNQVLFVENGDPFMGKISGTGCMAASVIGVCVGSWSDHLISAVTALAGFGDRRGASCRKISRVLVHSRLPLFDELAAVSPVDLKNHAKIRSE